MYNFKMNRLALLTIIGMSGCSLAPEYIKPEMPISNVWSDKDFGSSKGVTDIKWKDFYKNEDMQNLISMALEHNKDLRKAALNVQTAQAKYRIERSALMPSINAGVTKTAEHLPGNLYSTQTSGSVTYQQYQANLAATSWELDLFGKLRSLKESAWESYMAQEQTVKATRVSLIAEVGTAWLTLSGDNDLLKLSHDTYESQQKSYKLVEYGFKNGTATEQDLVQAEMNVKSAQADVTKYTRIVQLDKNSLNLLLGINAPDNLLKKATLKNGIYFPELSSGVPSEVMAQRPDIIAAEHSLKSANANIGAARAAFFPSISITASGGTASDSLNNLFDSGTGAWSFIPTLNVPIFTGGLNKANLDVAEISKNIEITNYEKAIQQAFREVSDSLVGRETFREEFIVRSEDTKASKIYYELASARFGEGVDSFLNVLIAQRSYYQSQQTLITTQQNLFIQDINLYKALGGGWK